jgi:hypothetical protein
MAVPPAHRILSHARLWFGFLGGAVAWTLHLILAYLIAEFGCESQMDRHLYMGITLPAWMLLIMSALVLLIAVLATVVAYLGRMKIEKHEHYAEDVHGSERYLTRAGYLMSGLFAFIIIVETIPTFYYLHTC